MTTARRLVLAALLCAVLCAVSITFIDRPVEAYVAAHQQFRILYQAMAAPSLVPLPFALVFLCYFAIARPAGPHINIGLSLSLAILGATTAKDELKWLFGRAWPGTWMKYGIYKFQPFTDSTLYGGFPSGHTAYISAPLCLLCWLVPQYRAAWITIMVIVMAGLIGAGYHFVGDTIAGFFTGLAAAAAVVSCRSSIVRMAGPRG